MRHWTRWVSPYARAAGGWGPTPRIASGEPAGVSGQGTQDRRERTALHQLEPRRRRSVRRFSMVASRPPLLRRGALFPRPATVVAMATVFTHYSEFDTPITTVPRAPEGTRSTLVATEQNGSLVFCAETTAQPVRPAPPAPPATRLSRGPAGSPHAPAEPGSTNATPPKGRRSQPSHRVRSNLTSMGATPSTLIRYAVSGQSATSRMPPPS